MAEASGQKARAVTVRAAVEADLPAILDIVNDAILHTTAMYEYAPRDLGMQTVWLHDKAADNWPVLVATNADGVLVGFGNLGSFRPRAAYGRTAEHSVYVSKHFRGQGYGRILLEALMKEARARDFHSLIGGIDSTNVASLAFHAAMGFEEVGRMREVGWKFDRWLTLVFMQKML